MTGTAASSAVYGNRVRTYTFQFYFPFPNTDNTHIMLILKGGTVGGDNVLKA